MFVFERHDRFVRDLSDLDLPEWKLDLSGCTSLERLPDPLNVPVVSLRGCESLVELPARVDAVELDLADCPNLRALPLLVEIGRLGLARCTGLRALPETLARVAELDLRGASGITAFPLSLVVTRRLEVAGTRLTSLPALGPRATLRWHGVPINERILLRPETITALDVLDAKNAELRSVLVERMGYERFIDSAGADTLDEDTDRGGPRRLLSLALSSIEEPIVLLSVRCPSTGKRYFLRVPPETPTCRHAAAWVAGFDDPDAYQPTAET